MRGGDCRHALGLGNLLQSHGHEVHYFAMKGASNIACTEDEEFFVTEIDYRKSIQNMHLIEAFRVAGKSIYSIEAKQKISRLLDKIQPDIVHLHSIRHHITKSILPEIAKRKIPVVWTLHDYKELCPNTSFYNESGICEKCKDRRYHQVISNRCKKNSLFASLLTYFESVINSRNIFEKCVDLYISPSRFLRNKFIEYGYSADRVCHLPNFIDYEAITPEFDNHNYLLFLGRLEKEKGLETLINGFAKIDDNSSLVLKIAGTGTMEQSIREKIKHLGLKKIVMEGFVEGEKLDKLIRFAKAIVIPSEWYENYPFSALEAMSYGKPVIASNIGGLPELIEEGGNGFLFEPFDDKQLSEKMIQIDQLSENQIAEMGKRSRQKVESENDMNKFLDIILDIYKNQIKWKQC